MDLHEKYDECTIKQLLQEFIIATGRCLQRLYNNYLLPYITDVILLHAYNIKNPDEIPDAMQNVHLAVLNRLRKMKSKDIQDIKSPHDYFFIMVKRLILNEIDKIKVADQRKILQANAAQYYYNNQNVFIINMEEDDQDSWSISDTV